MAILINDNPKHYIMWGVKPTELEDEAGDDELSHDSEEEEEELRDCETLYHLGQTFKVQETNKKLAALIVTSRKSPNALIKKISKATAKFKDVKDAIKDKKLTPYESERIKTLKSWKLPIALALSGLSSYGLGWLFKALGTGTEEVTEKTVTTVTDKLANIEPGEGMTQILNRAFGSVDLSPTSAPSEVIEALKQVGDGNLQRGVDIDFWIDKGGENSGSTDKLKFVCLFWWQSILWL